MAMTRIPTNDYKKKVRNCGKFLDPREYENIINRNTIDAEMIITIIDISYNNFLVVFSQERTWSE